MALCRMPWRLMRMTPQVPSRPRLSADVALQCTIKRQRRHLSLHEHQSQKLLSQLGVPVARSVSEVGEAIDKLGKANWYLAMTIDREIYGPVIVVSKRGGRDIGEIARRFPDSISTFHFGLSSGITPDVVADMSMRLGTRGRQAKNLKHLVEQMFDIFSRREATMLEINPLACSGDGTFTSISSRFVLDDAAAKRQPETFALGEASDEVSEVSDSDSDSVLAEKHGLVYVRMDGNVGNVVNGAGLAMATNDAISFEGGASANFLDAGGKATKETMQQALGIVTRDDRVKAILVNIYGGLTRCDMVAEAIIAAAVSVPMVVRLQGTNSERGFRLLGEANLGLLYVESDFGRAARRVVELAESARVTMP